MCVGGWGQSCLILFFDNSSLTIILGQRKLDALLALFLLAHVTWTVVQCIFLLVALVYDSIISWSQSLSYASFIWKCHTSKLTNEHHCAKTSIHGL